MWCRLILVIALVSGCLPLRPEPAVRKTSETPLATAEVKTRIVPAASDSMIRQASASDLDPIESLHRAAVDRFAAAPSFVARLKRRESPAGRAKPEELILFKERKSPTSVHFKWIGTQSQGREVLYVQGAYGDKLQIVTAANDVPFTPAGSRMSLARDSMLVKAANPNHDITHCGLAYNLKDLGMLYQAGRDPASGVVVKYLGNITRPESPQPMPGVEIKLPPGRDPDVPRGGTRQVFYCPRLKLPVLFICLDETGREQNYNYYDRIELNLNLDDQDFNPDHLWGKSKKE